MPRLLTEHNPPLLTAEALSFTRLADLGMRLTAHAGERVGILGVAGSGKTQLLRCLARLDPVVAGRLRWGTVDVTHKARWLLGRHRSYVALILQNPYTFLEPWLQAGTFLAKWPHCRRRDEQKITAHLQRVGLASITQAQRVQNLSGMDRVLLVLAYALLSEPTVLLLDDVFGMLLPEVWGTLLAYIQKALRPQQALIVASQYGQVLQGVDTVFVLWQGQVVEWGAREAVFSTPYHTYTRDLVAGQYGMIHHSPKFKWGANVEVAEIAPQHWVGVVPSG